MAPNPETWHMRPSDMGTPYLKSRRVTLVFHASSSCSPQLRI